MWHAEWVVAECEIAFVVVLVHREVNNPAEAECVFLKKVKTNAKLCSHIARLLFNTALFCKKSNETVWFESETFNECVFRICREFCNTACKFTVFVEFEPIHIACTVEFCLFGESVNPLSRLGEVVNSDSLDDFALFKKRRFLAENIRHVLDYERVAKVRLVGTIVAHCVAICDAAERSFVHLVALWRELFENA